MWYCFARHLLDYYILTVFYYNFKSHTSDFQKVPFERLKGLLWASERAAFKAQEAMFRIISCEVNTTES